MTEREMLEQLLHTQSQMIKDFSDMKSDICNMKDDICHIKGEIQNINLHLENVTDKNLAILSENHVSLVKKLDENLKITDTQFAYQIKVNCLTEEVSKLKREFYQHMMKDGLVSSPA
ncbi:MAG: hypothetical protein PUI16_07690 [Clostridia bacterium]|nr:hypothetical protein [Clostridia bacterium]MDY5555490.1 hypothetical protein [Blautia sp.]